MGYLQDNRQGQRIYSARGTAPTLTCWTPVRVWSDQERVRITKPREMARLQAIPDELPVPTSEQAANSLFGNAVCVDVTREIFESLFFQEDASMHPMYPALFNP